MAAMDDLLQRPEGENDESVRDESMGAHGEKMWQPASVLVVDESLHDKKAVQREAYLLRRTRHTGLVDSTVYTLVPYPLRRPDRSQSQIVPAVTVAHVEGGEPTIVGASLDMRSVSVKETMRHDLAPGRVLWSVARLRPLTDAELDDGQSSDEIVTRQRAALRVVGQLAVDAADVSQLAS